MTSSRDDLPARGDGQDQTNPTPSTEDPAEANRFTVDDLWAETPTRPAEAGNGRYGNGMTVAGADGAEAGSETTLTSSNADALPLQQTASLDSGESRASQLRFDGQYVEGEYDAEAYPAAIEGGESSGKRWRRAAWEIIQTLVLAALIFFLVRAVAQNFRVEGPSMEPGLQDGQYLLVNKAVYFKLNLDTLSRYIPFIDAGDDPEHFLFHGPHRGDVIVFRYPRDPSRDFIKRVIGVPGDTITIQDGKVSVNGVQLEEPYIHEETRGPMEPTVVPADSYFVLGDNRGNSSDSRSWGFVPEENIIGKAMFSYWPLDDFGGVGNHSLDLGFISVPLP